jgi:tRNA G10  N-methylase Trm11
MIGLSTGYNVIGVDNDNALVSVAKNNLQWMSKKLETKLSWEIIKGNAEDFKSKPDGVVFEPYMGPFLKDLPKFMEAINIRKELDTLYTKTFKNLSNNLDSGTPVVCILPDIPTRDGKLLETPKEVFSKNQFRLHTEESIQLPNPVKYNTPGGSIVQRRIYLLVKS